MLSVIKERSSSREDLICVMYILRRGCTNSGRPNFVRWSLMFVGPQDGTCFMLPCKRLEFLGGFLIFWKIVELCTKTSWNIVEPISRNVLLRFGTHWVWIIFDLRDTKEGSDDLIYVFVNAISVCTSHSEYYRFDSRPHNRYATPV